MLRYESRVRMDEVSSTFPSILCGLKKDLTPVLFLFVDRDQYWLAISCSFGGFRVVGSQGLRRRSHACD
jgi:hypothetical protein